MSKERAIIVLIDEVSRAIDEGINTQLVFFMIYLKLLITIDHRILIGQLEYYGIRGRAKCWFESYL